MNGWPAGLALAFDPSTTATGYAVGEVGGGVVRSWVEVGRIHPRAAGDATQRIAETARDVASVLRRVREEHGEPIAVAVEIPSRYQRRQQGRQGLLTYARGAGAVEGVCLALDVPVIAVDAGDWTSVAGVNASKEQRLRWLQLRAPMYNPATDPGGDAGDAMCILEWFAATGGTRRPPRSRAAKPAPTGGTRGRRR